MDYFDNYALVESINAEGALHQYRNHTNKVKFLVAGLALVISVAAIYIYKYQRIKKSKEATS